MLQQKRRVSQIMTDITLVIGLGLSPLASVYAEDELRLEGTSLLGAQRQAHVAWQGTRTTVKVGDEIGEWQVIDISHHKIDLQNTAGETQQFALYAQPPLAVTEVTTTTSPQALDEYANTGLIEPADSTAFAAIAEEDYAVKSMGDYTTTVPATVIREYIPVSELQGQAIPSGYEQVKTPFGEFVVKQRRQSRTARLAEQAQDLPQESSQQEALAAIPSGYQKVKTPFGELIVPINQAE